MALCMDRIRRGSAAALVALGVAACDSNMPETFNAEATSGDVNAMTGIFAAPVFALSIWIGKVASLERMRREFPSARKK